MQFTLMFLLMGSLVWPGDAQRGQCAVDLQYFAEVQISSSFETVWKILSFEYNFCNIYWVHPTATMVNGKAG